MHKKIVSDRSRQYTRNALEIIKQITSKYTSCPNSYNLGEEKAVWLNDAIRRLGESIRQTNFLGFSFFHKFRHIRNDIAHSTEHYTPTENNKLWKNVFNWIKTDRSELEQNLSRAYSSNKTIRRFEKFGTSNAGSEEQRKQLVDAIQDSFDISLTAEERANFPVDTNNKYTSPVYDILHPQNNEQQQLLTYVQSHENLQIHIQEEILEWIVKTDLNLTKENPFYDEMVFSKKLSSMTSIEIAENISKHKYHYKRLSSVSANKRGSIQDSPVDFDFYIKQFEKNMTNNNKDTVQLEVLSRNLKQDVEQALIDRYNAWEIEQIENARKLFMDELYRKIAAFRKLEELLSPFIENLGYLWDMTNRPFTDCGFEILKQYAFLLGQDESLQELAKMLGRQTREQISYEKEIRDKIDIITEYHPRSAYKGQISGLRLSNDISAVLPSELVLFKHPSTRLLFAKKFAEKQLLSYAYENITVSERQVITKEEIEVAVTEPKGPIIVCVDTSGSMHSAPERIAKTVTFALSKMAIEEKRACYLVSFSTGIETLDISSFKSSNALSQLVGFLRKSFHGGTDANPALVHAVGMLQENEWKNADILMISDFIMNNLSDELIENISKEQENETHFFSLSIGSSGNQMAIACFDENWTYDINSPDAQRHLVRQLSRFSVKNSQKKELASV